MNQPRNHYFAIVICFLFSSVISYGQNNNPPIAVSDNYPTIQNTSVNGNILNNDSDPDGDMLTVNTSPVTTTFNGSLVLNSNGSFNYTPNNGHTGVDFFQYQVCDNGTPSLCDTGFVKVNTGPLPSSLTVDTVYKTFARNQTPYITVYHDELLGFSIGITNLNCQPLKHGNYLFPVASGIGTPMATTFLYLTSNTSGIDTLCILETDYDFGTSDTTIFIITVVNNPPNAVDDYYTTPVNTLINDNVLSNDNDPDGDSLIISTTPIVDPSKGSIIINPDGSFTYVSNPGFTGQDTCTYQICDVSTPSFCDTATIYFNITNDCNFLPDTLNNYYLDACNDSADICLPFPRGDTAYTILVDGQPYSTYTTGKYDACMDDSLIVFDLNNVQSTGPWMISYTQYPLYVNQDLYKETGLVNNFNDLVDSLDNWKKYIPNSVHWMLNPDNTISSARKFSGLLQFTDINTNVVSSIQANVEYLSTALRIPVTAHEVRIIGDTCTEIMIVDIACHVGIDSLTITDASSCATADGSIIVHANYGSGNYEYSLHNSDVNINTGWQTSPVFTGLQSHDDYTVSVKDITDNEFDNEFDVEIKGLDKPMIHGISLVADTISIQATGSALPLEYRIIPEPFVNILYQSSNQFHPFNEGKYNALVRYNNGLCEVETGFIDIKNNTGLAISNVTSTNISDCNHSDGNINIAATITSTNTVYYSIDSGQTWQANHYFPNLSNGTYHVATKAGLDTVFYANNPVIIIEPIQPIINSVASIPPTGCGLSNGSITITASGGSGNLEYSIDCGSNWQPSNVFTNLSGGTYCIQTRNDDGSCFVEWSPLTLNAPPVPLIINIAYTDPSDCGVADGTITITASSNTALEYSIDGGINFQASNLFTGLIGGTYQVVVRNNNGTCPVSAPDVILVDKVMPIITSVITVDPSGCGINDASIAIAASGASIEYSIDGGINWQSSSSFTGLGSGCYNVSVRNTDGSCQVDDTNNPFCITAPGSPIITNVNTSNPTTCASTDGTITITASGGSGNYQYSIDCGMTYQSSNIFTGLSGGTYCVYISNTNGSCPSTASAVTLNTPASTVTNVSFTNPTNCGVNDGTITITGSSDPALEYSINNGSAFQTSNTFTGLSAGSYQVVTRYNNGNCVTIHPSITVLTSPISPQINNVSFTNPTNCGINDGIITIIAYGNVALEYSINNGATFQVSNTFTGLSAGSYQVVTRYNNGNCPIIYPVNTVLTSPVIPQINNVSFTNPTNCGVNDGTITITASGSATLEYSINNGTTFQTSNTFTGLSDGSYQIVTRYNNGNCPITYLLNTVLTSPVSPQINNVSFTNPTNCATSDGTITISASNGTAPLEYSLDSGITWLANGGNFTGLSCGSYDIWVSNTSGTCPTSYGNLILDVINQAPITVNDYYTTNINTPITGSILTNDSDPNGDSLLLLTTPIFNPVHGNIVMLPNGEILYTPNLNYTGQDSFAYSVCDNGLPSLCETAVVYINIILPPLQIVNISNTNESCSQGNGSINITASNGTAVYEYSIDNQQTWQSSSYFGNLSAGNYHAFVRNGSDTAAYISNPITISDTLAPVIVSTNYNSDTLIISATAAQPMQYSIDCGATWQNSNVFFPVPNGNLCVGVRLNIGSCPVFSNIALNNNPPIAVADSIIFQQGGYQTLNVIQNDYDLENNLFFTVPQTTYYGSDSLTLDSNGIMSVPTEAWNLGSFVIPYQVCEVYNPSNCSQGTAYITITPSTQFYSDTMAIGATQAVCIPNNLPGTPISGTVISSFTNNIIDSIVTNCLYIYGDNYGTDTAIVVVCDNLGFCDTTHLFLNVTDGVWPGDTDDDTYVDNFDLLNIGLGYGQIGTPRNVITNVWNGYVTPFWNTATPISNIDYRHADSDGDGIVSSLDTIAILQNYASSYQRGGTSILGGIPIQVGQDTGSIFPKYSLPILFGDLANPVTGLYGGAFSIAYDTSIIKVNSVSISFDTTWAGTKNIDIITIQKNLPNDNQVDAAFTRIDGNNANGFGLIGQLNFTIKDDILQRRGFNADSVWTQFHIFDTKFISNDETLIAVDELSSDVLITSTNKIQPRINHLVAVFPNPAKDFVNISTQNLKVNYISISDMTGRVIYFEKGSYGNLQNINIESLQSGVYTIQLQTDKGLAVKRLTIIK